MRKLLLLLPLLTLASCSYPSKYEAKAACGEWVNRGGEYIHFQGRERDAFFKFRVGDITADEYLNKYKPTEENRKIRYCTHEKETRQYLGWDSGKKEGETWVWGDQTDRKIIKRFRY